MANLYWLDQICPDHLPLVGFKAFYLSQLFQQGCPVIPGFVVSTRSLKTFLESVCWTSPLFADLPGSALRVNTDNPYQLQAIAQELRHVIATSPLPSELIADITAALPQLAATPVILRPSLWVESPPAKPKVPLSEMVAQSASLFHSEVVAAQPEAIAAGLKRLWENLFNARSLFYWQRLQIPLHRVKVAVLVQPIQSAIAAGTLHSDPQHLILRATPGLGMAIARGEVIPDRYELNRIDGQLVSKQLGQRSLAYHIQTEELQSYWLNDNQRSEYSLPDDTLPLVAKTLHPVLSAMGTAIELEWVLPDGAAGELTPLVTQVIPQVPATPLLTPTTPPTEPERQPVELFPGARLIATGLAASAGQAIAAASVVHDITLPASALPPHSVWVVPSVPLNWLPKMQETAALVSEQGSLTSHSAIVARELGIPAVMGVTNITQHIQPGEMLWVDGDRGRVYRFDASPAALEPTLPTAALPLKRSQSPLATKLWVNLSQPYRLSEIAALPIDGVGVLRSELLALTVFEGQLPLEWLQQHSAPAWIDRMAHAIAQFTQAFYPRPVFYRSFDWRSHELVQSENSPPNTLGLRGTYSYQVDDRLFTLELKTLQMLQERGDTNLRLLLPFVRTVEEFQFCHQRVQEMGLPQVPDFQLWMMAEVPSVLFLLPDYVEAGVQGISIGTNDLTQLLLGVDRDDPLMATAFAEAHPAVQRAIAQLLEAARSLGIPCAICGEAPVRHPELIPTWVQRGVDAISVTPEAVETIYQRLVQAESE